MSQLLLIPDPRPLDERLGRQFFRDAPSRPGVYVMRDAAEKVLYVGKAKDLRRRLGNYRIANPDRLPRRHLRLLRQVARIEFQFCPDEPAALRRESKLLRALKPPYNRAGVWPGPAKFFVWRRAGDAVEMGVAEVPAAGWRRFGPLGAGARHLRRVLARLLWLAVHPARPVTELPPGWARGGFPEKLRLHCGDSAEEVAALLAVFFWETPDHFPVWLASRLEPRTHPFERALIQEDLETLQHFSTRLPQSAPTPRQLPLL